MVFRYYVIKYFDVTKQKNIAKVFNNEQSAMKFTETINTDNWKILKTNNPEEVKSFANKYFQKEATENAFSLASKKLEKQENKKRVIDKKNDEDIHKIENNIKKISIEDFSDSQKEAYEVMMNGENCFLTGMAGTGKTTLINKFVQDSRAKGKIVMVTASTGIAAENLGGLTIHKYLSIPWNDLGQLIQKDWKNLSQGAKSLLRTTDILIIDEISMIDYVVFEFIITMIEHANKNKELRNIEPIQLIVVGDFLQLPPVVDDKMELIKKYYPKCQEGFCFESEAWERMNFKFLKLKEVMRQSEEEYINALVRLKIGDLSIRKLFNQHYYENPEIPKNAIYLYGTNNDSNIKNLKELEKIDKQLYTFKNNIHIKAGYKGKITLAFPETLNVKVGARVMSLVNDLNGAYKNGSLGTVVNIDGEGVTVAFDNGKTVKVKTAEEEHYAFRIGYNAATDKQEIIKDLQYIENNIPLKLAYAITIHKSQGQTFDNVVIHPTCFANGQLYVALSRCKTLDGIYLLKEIEESDIKVSQEVIEFERKNNLI